jgi:MoaA/NifB/PqqE/SkfB family radical SAM enzyme
MKGVLSAFAVAAQKRALGNMLHRLRKVYVEPTTRCNLRCRTCMRRSWDEPAADMAMATYGRLLDSLRKIRTVHTVAYWGIGEPLMHPRIAEMVGSTHDLGLQTELITNAQLLDETLAAGLIDAGLDRIVISIDGTTPAGLPDSRLGADLGRIQENVGILRRLRQDRGVRTPEIAAEFVLMRRNLGQVRDLPGIARELGAGSVYLTNVLPYSRDVAAEILYPLSATSEAFAIRFGETNGFVLPRIDARPEILEAMRSLLLRVSRDFVHPLLLPGNHGTKCPFLERGALAVRWDGAVSPCVELLHSHTVYVLGREKHIQRCMFGTLERQTLDAIWQQEEYTAFRKRLCDFEFSPCVGCGGCDMAESNEEDCIGSPFPTCGDCLWARGVILCP